MKFFSGIARRGYWKDRSEEGHFFDEMLALELLRLFQGKSVLDIGCGKGEYVAFFRRHGIVCDGIDGNPYTPRMTQGMCGIADCSKPLALPQHDWVLSLEVGEHVPARYEAVFLNNIFAHAKQGAVLSWAVPGQGGRGHVNTRDNAYIKARCAAAGFHNDLQAEEALRTASTLPWFTNTLMVFRRL